MSDYNRVKGLYLSQLWDYETPSDIFGFLNVIFPFTLDAAANPQNTKCKDFIDEETNALTVDWETEGFWWLNPPWGRKYTKATGYSIDDWVKHALKQYENYRLGVAIVSARTDTKWWQNTITKVPWVWFPKGRVAFLYEGEVKSQPNFPSAVLIFCKTLYSWQRKFLKERGHLLYTDHAGFRPLHSQNEGSEASAINHLWEVRRNLFIEVEYP